MSANTPAGNLGLGANPQATQQQTQQQQTQQQAATVAQLFNAYGGRANSGSGDAEVQNIADIISEYFTDRKEYGGFQVIQVSGKLTGNYGAVVIAHSSNVGGRQVANIYTIMVEKSKATPLEPHVFNYGATPIEIFVSPSDAYTAEYRQRIADALAKRLPTGTTIVPSGWTVALNTPIIYPTAADGKPAPTLSSILPMVEEAINSIDNTLNAVAATSNAPAFNLDMVAANPQVRIRSNITLDAEKQTINGLPIRSDIKSELVFNQAATPGKAVPDGEEFRAVEMAAYVDLIYVPPAQTYFSGAMMQQPMGVPYYIPRVVITNMAVDMPHSSLEFMLLGLASMISLSNQRSYGIVWRDNFGQHPERNLGAVGLQVPGISETGEPEILDVSGDVRTLYSLMDTVLSPNPVFTLELTAGGQSNYVNSVIAKAASNNPGAQDKLRQAADNLTGGRFSQILATMNNNGPAQPFVTTTDEPAYVGHYKRDGELRDIRELDLLAMLNLIGQKDPDMVSRYLSTFGSVEPVQSRLARRAQIMKNVAKDVVLKGYAKKYDFGANFIQALVQAIHGCGIAITNDNMLNGNMDNTYTQSISQWTNNMVNPASVGAMFAPTVPQMPQYYNNFGNPVAGY